MEDVIIDGCQPRSQWSWTSWRLNFQWEKKDRRVLPWTSGEQAINYSESCLAEYPGNLLLRYQESLRVSQLFRTTFQKYKSRQFHFKSQASRDNTILVEQGAPHIAQEEKKQSSLETRSGFTERVKNCSLLMQGEGAKGQSLVRTEAGEYQIIRKAF